ncbi:hypothetical protein [Aeromicrobium sp. CFBP 8757]|nr:hypothetical protein [Aeromicrobium sp. CFBP 8757]
MTIERAPAGPSGRLLRPGRRRSRRGLVLRLAAWATGRSGQV